MGKWKVISSTRNWKYKHTVHLDYSQSILKDLRAQLSSAPKSILSVFLWSLLNMCRAAKKNGLPGFPFSSYQTTGSQTWPPLPALTPCTLALLCAPSTLCFSHDFFFFFAEGMLLLFNLDELYCHDNTGWWEGTMGREKGEGWTPLSL